MKKKSLFIILFTLVCLFLVAGCSSKEKYVTGIEQTSDGVKVFYSDGSSEEIDIVGQPGEKGETGEQGQQGIQGIQGEPGEPAKGVEFRYYRSKLWWRYEGTDTWYVLVSKDALDAEDLSLSDGDFAMSVYVEEYDISIDISTYVKVNGSWTNAEVSGNTVTFSKEIDENTYYFDVTKENDQFTILCYQEEGVNETTLEYIANESLEAFVGSYSLNSGEEEVIIKISEYGTPTVTTSSGSIWMSGYVKGNTYVGYSNGTGENFTLVLAALGSEVTTEFKDADGNLTKKADWQVTAWEPVENLLGSYTMYVDGGEAFDFALKANESLNLYDDTYPRYSYKVDTATFTVNEVTYTVKLSDAGELVATTSVDGKTATVKKWDDVLSMLTTFATVEGSDSAITWTINSYGGVNKDGSYYGSAYQQKNTVYMKPWGSNEYYAVTYVSDSATFTAERVVSTDGSETKYPVSLVMDATIEDFLGKYNVSYTNNGNDVVVSFEIGKNPYADGYAFIYGGNPNNYTMSERTLTYINNRGGMGYMVTANLDGTKSVTYFMVDANGDPNPSTYIECTVVFTPNE